MVATRRGARARSPSETPTEQRPDVQATPSTVRRTRRSVKETPVRPEEKSDEGPPPSAASMKRRSSRVSRLRNTQQPPTTPGSAHEADTSDLDSCYSAESAPSTQTMARRRRTQTRRGENEISDVESCSSAASKPGYGTRRSTRRKTGSESSVAGHPEVGGATEIKSTELRVTRSQRRSTRNKSAAKPVDSELSDSCTSSVSEQTPRRPKRSIPAHKESVPARQTRTTRSRAASTVSEPPSWDSDGFESGPTYSSSARRRGKTPSARDSDSEDVELHSTPCSSRASSGTASRRRQISRVNRAAVVESDEEETSLNDSKLETTVVAEKTLLEEEATELTEEKNDAGLSANEEEKEETDTTQCDEDESRPAVTVKDQQGEPSADSSEMMQENLPSSEASPSVTVTFCEKVPEKMEEKQELPVDTEQEMKPCEEEKEEKQELPVDTEQEMKPCEEKKQEEEEKQEHMEVCRPDAQQVEDLQETAGGSQEAPDSKQQPQAAFSLLDSSDEDEELDEELEEGSAQEDLDHMDQERGETSSKSKPAAASVEGLFMIDTRPGQDPDQQYYTDWKGEEDKNKRSEEEEPDEDEFVDEEEEEDEDAEILLSSRNSHLKELSSRIDPGISVKKLGGLYISFDGSKSKGVSTSGQKPNGKTTLDEVMKKSVIGPDFEKKDAVPPYKESKEALKLKRRAERQKSTGDGWFNMKAPEVSQELKGDLQVLKMRGSLDPKRFYKKNDRDGFPKYFQVGTVVDSPLDFYHSRVPKKERKRTMVEELLTDAEFRQKNKKRFQQIMAEKAAQAAGKHKKKNKFHKKSS
ncbi:deoxynucleotidyltransferase terminal-interacting protein 2 isoform X2 [Oryzias melastigma]|uniref:Deoxynucleotidyltransferase, terminal, interacting protein 2 n=1 Tax=Oryzias melastigma TaxID=30732 RepID=A0A3B3BSD7_ORYME|nr:deoxynucleotidyltransferase terminal-interacting protein 2 isoform X2 [Oryzias melastigma]